MLADCLESANKVSADVSATYADNRLSFCGNDVCALSKCWRLGNILIPTVKGNVRL